MRDADYVCPWCPYEAPVPHMLTDHKTRCDMRPPEDT